MKRTNIRSGAIWEEKISYSRAVQVGNQIEIAGTVATDGITAMFPDSPYDQTVFILNKIKTVLESAGASLDDVVRTRMYVVNIDQWEEIGRAHGELFKGINPVTTMVEVSRLIAAEYLIEIEATAIVNKAEN